MTSELNELDKLCRQILLILSRENSPLSYAEIQRKGNMSYKTVKKHTHHLEKLGLVKVEDYWEGQKRRYRIYITEKGMNLLKMEGD